MAGMFDINTMRQNLKYGGARTNLFLVNITPPSGVTTFNSGAAKFLIQAAKLPEVQMGQIEVPYMGRKLRLPGDRTFPAWTVTVINDEDFMVRNAMEEWMSKINGITNNLRDPSFKQLSDFKSASATVTQYTKTGGEARSYRFEGLYPTEISSIDLDWSQNDQIEYFQVTFMYDYWTVGTSGTGKATGLVGN